MKLKAFRTLKLQGLALVLVAFFFIAFPLSRPVYAGSEVFVSKIGGSDINGVLHEPDGIAVDSLGNIYVVDASNVRVQKFDSSGNFLAKWGSYGTGNGEFHTPTGIAIDASNNVYVSDSGNNTIQKFTSTGTYITKWSVPTPAGVAVDRVNNFVYVASNVYDSRVYKFTLTGTELTNWGGHGSTAGLFDAADSIAIDAIGNVYVTDTYNARVQKFTSSGSFLLEIPNVWYSSGVVVDAEGYIYATDSRFKVIHKFDATGSDIATLGSLGGGDGQFLLPMGITLDTSGNLLVTDASCDRVQKLSASGTYISQFGQGLFNYPAGVATDSAGNLYVVSTNTHKIEKFDSSGNFVTQWGTNGSGNGQLAYPSDVAVDSAGNVYVADTSNKRVAKYTSSGVFVSTWGSAGSQNGQFSYPKKIAVDNSGNVYVLDSENYNVQKFTSDGDFLMKFGTLGNSDGQFNGFMKGLTVDSLGNIYVAHTDYLSRGYVQKFTSAGTFVEKWGSYGVGTKAFATLAGLSADSSDNIYVVEVDHNRVKKFDANGNFLFQWGSIGWGSGQFYTPEGITADNSGNVYVTDLYNSSVQKFNYSNAVSTPVVFIKNHSLNVQNTTANIPSGVASDGGSTITERGVVYSMVNALPTFADTKVTISGTTGEFAAQLNLSVNNFYYVRAFATNAQGTSYSDTEFFYMSDSPTVTTDTGTVSYTAYSAQISGNVTTDGGSTITSRGVVYSSTSSEPTLENDDVASADGELGQYSIMLTNLNAQTLYYARAYASNAGYTSYGETVNFTTLAYVEPTVTTDSYSDVTPTNANVAGTVATDGSALIVERGVVYSAVHNVPDYDFDNIVTADAAGAGSFVSTLPGLESETTYYARAYAVDLVAVYYGETVTFTTGAVSAPVLSNTSSVSNITKNSAKVTGNVLSDGGDAITERGIVYSSVQNQPTVSDSKLVIAGSTGAYFANLVGLLPTTGYYARAYSINSLGTTYGNTVTFTTLDAPVISVDLSTYFNADGVSFDANPGDGSFSTNSEALVADTYPATITIKGVQFATGPTTDGAQNIVRTTGQNIVLPPAHAATLQLIAGNTGADAAALPFIIHYTDLTESTVNVDFSNWLSESPLYGETIALTQDHTNSASGQDTGNHPHLYWYSIPLDAAKVVKSIDVPNTSGDLSIVAMTEFDTQAVTLAAPTVATGVATNLSYTSVTIGGDVLADGNEAVTERGVVYSSVNNPVTMSDTKVITTGQVGTFTVDLSGLTPGTTYYVRAYAINAQGTTMGDVISVDTPAAVAPILTTTSPATSITTTGATVTGTVTSDGGSAITERGVIYSSTNNNPLSDTKVVVSGTTGSLSHVLTGLTPDTTYYARIYATNSLGTTYGNVISFKTLAATPTYPQTLVDVYYTFGKLRYGRYATPSQMRSGDMIYLKNYNPKKVQLLAISLYDYKIKGNQCYSRVWKSTTSMMMKTCGLLPTNRKYAFIFTFKDTATGIMMKKYFVVNTISPSTITL